MFIDGLDEFDGPGDIVLNMIKDLADQTYVKVCVSSRPLLAFEEAFTGKPSLRLQDLTFDSIRDYAAVKLSDPIQKYISLNQYDLDETEYLVDRMVDRAEGVFLWAVIAVRGLREGLRGIASFHELAQTIEALPSEIESLFMLMLNNIKPVFRRDAAKFLEMTLYGYGRQDLCTLYLSHSQSELSDAPFSYDTFNTKDLITDCKTLETRLKSHTAGLLELTPTDKGGRTYGKSEDPDPVLFTRVNFFHRATRDFLLNNDQAKSFLARNGSGEAQVHLSIARGQLARLAHFSRGDPKCVDDEWPNPAFGSFLESLFQIAIAERILGVAQPRLMQSLDYEFFSRGFSVIDKPRYSPMIPPSYMKTRSGTAVDQVGMAAAMGMTIFVCEKLDLSTESRSYPCNLPNLKDYSRNQKMMTTLSWHPLHQSPTPDTDLVVGSHHSTYRQALGGCLWWEVSSQTQSPSEKHLLAETFLLSCCEPTCHDLARILLRAGANPMVQVKPEGLKPHLRHTDICSESFWEKWLQYLRGLHYNYMVADGRSGGIMFHHSEIDVHVTLKDIFDVTKALLAQGANINFRPWPPIPTLKRLSPSEDYGLDVKVDLAVKVTAMFILEKCFNTESEFRHFASEIEPLVETPTREIEGIYPIARTYRNFSRDDIHPKPEESEMLWPLIEKWEETGRREDKDALEAALEDVWRAHHPGFGLKTHVSDSSDGNNEDDINDINSYSDNWGSEDSGERDEDKNDSTA